MTLLAFLPQVTINSILGEEMSPSVIKLWICGDRLMQHKISTGITVIKLVDRRELSSSRFPKFIEELRSLRELTIDRNGFSMSYNLGILMHLRQLPPTLKKLIIRVTGSLHLIYPPTPNNTSESLPITQHPTTDDLNPANWEFNSAFPQLETLELECDANWDHWESMLLPQSLTSLTIPPPTKCIDESFSTWLPRNLLALDLGRRSKFLSCFTSSFWANLPPQLTTITATAKRHKTETNPPLIPRSLTCIKGNFWCETLDLKDLPPGLNTLSTSWLKPSVTTDLSTATDLSGLSSDTTTTSPQTTLAKIFPNLNEISINFISAENLCLLPSSIHTIDAEDMNGDNDDEDDGDEMISPDVWPKSLTKLTLSDTEYGYLLMPPLPSIGLTMLCIYGNCRLNTSYISSLPRTLRHLLIESRYLLEPADSKPIVYPPHLTFLSVWPAYIVVDHYDLRNLPASLTYFKIRLDILASQLKMLPPRLKHLEICEITLDSGFDPSSELEIEAMRSNFANGAAQGIQETFDSNRPDRASIFALFPRTLTYFKMRLGELKCDSFGWRMMPPLLESIDCSIIDGFPVNFLQEMPKTLRSLDLRISGVEDHHLQLIPKHLRFARLYCVNSPYLTSNGVKNLPIWCQIIWPVFRQ